MHLPVQDPIDVLRAALAERAKWQKLFLDGGLSRDEASKLLHLIEGARGREHFERRENQRALSLLLKGRPDWFEGLVRNPAAVPANVRAALAEIAATYDDE
jgi:hypothetical protein